MLKKLTEVIIRYRWFVIAFWVVLAAVVFFTAPNLTSVAKNDQTSFLPADASTVKADKLIKELFPDKGGRSSLVLVIMRRGGILQKDTDYIRKFENYIDVNRDKYKIREILSPFTKTELEKQMISKDRTVALINLNLTAPAYTDAVNRTFSHIRDIVKSGSFTVAGNTFQLPKGLEVYLTGDASMGAEEHESVNKSLDLTVKITIVLVLIILVIIYRTPIAPILPLFTIGLSFVISRGIVASLTGFGFKVSTFTESFLIAVLFGAGTDYCLLIISRFKEMISSGKSTKEALVESIPNTGIAIISSGGTVIVGFLFMIFARFGLFNTTGPSVAIGVAITLIAVLTLIPAMITVLGERIFWPAENLHALKNTSITSVWTGISNAVTLKPVRFIVIATAVLIPFIIAATGIRLSYDQLKELPSYTDSVKGYELMKNKFAQGEMFPIKIVVKSDKNMWDSGSLSLIDRLADNILKVDNVTKVRTASRPLGEKITEATLPVQINLLSNGLDKIGEGFEPIRTGLADMQNGIKKIADGIGKGGDELGKLSDATGRAAQSISQTRTGMSKLEYGTNSAADGLDEIGKGIDALKNGIVQSEQGLGKTGAVIDDSIAGLEKVMLNNKEISSNKDFQTAYYALKAVSGSMKDMMNGLEKVRLGLENSSEGIFKTGSGLSGIKNGISSSNAALEQIQKGLDIMKEGQIKAVEGFDTASDSLLKIAKGIDPGMEALVKIKSGIKEIRDTTRDYSSGKNALDDVFFLPPEAFEKYPDLKKAMENYISPDGKGFVMDAVLSTPPFTNKSLDTIAELKRVVEFTLKGTALENSEFNIGGATSALSEVRKITSRDFTVVMLFVLIGIFIVLVILLRSLITPVYLIITILLSFASTMGISYLVFQVILGYDGLHWSVPFFAFCVLIALGVDYNIFLMSRVKEEYRPGDTTGSIARALSSTGGIITSCGIIMAGTFGAMLASPIRPIVEVGFAAVVGLLIDTFIIRCLIVPAIAVKFGELNWWPGRKVKITSAG